MAKGIPGFRKFKDWTWVDAAMVAGGIALMLHYNRKRAEAASRQVPPMLRV